MTRLANTMRLDTMIQYRNRLYHIAIGLSILIVIVARFFVERTFLPTGIPSYFLLAVGGTTLMFVAGMIIFEKGERTLDGLIVTPLTVREYLISKIATLSLIAVLEASIVALAAYGFGFNFGYLYSGLVLIAVMNVLIGIVLVVRFDSVTDFLVPATGVSLVLTLPVFFLMNLAPWLEAIWYAIPTTAPYMLMLEAFVPAMIAPWQVAYGYLYSLAWIGGLAWWAYRAFRSHIILQGGS